VAEGHSGGLLAAVVGGIVVKVLLGTRGVGPDY